MNNIKKLKKKSANSNSDISKPHNNIAMIQLKLKFEIILPNFSQPKSFELFNKNTYSKNFNKDMTIKNIFKSEFELFISEVRNRYPKPTIIDGAILDKGRISYANNLASTFEGMNCCLDVVFTHDIIKVVLVCDATELCDFFTTPECSVDSMNKLIKDIGIIIGQTHTVTYMSGDNKTDITNFSLSLKDLLKNLPQVLTLILTKIETKPVVIDEKICDLQTKKPKKVSKKIIKSTELEDTTTSTKKPKVIKKVSETADLDNETPSEIPNESIVKAKPGRPRKIPVSVRTAVWKKYYGDDGKGKCYVGCGEDITVHNFECGHVIAHANGGTITIDNLRPVCSRCNKSMRTTNLEEFIAKYGFKSQEI